ncbi:asparagine synthase (glutamine-hydrolyzing) [Pyxidicoccus fallax]|uniref:asparagine synthase (glutamine-hydrolyzing) n=1 Tax=Pyxidicoccus fallax TaxID=394095 RepID=A0A848LUF7_9BACT|nr:asparagine synthase (glutamine-hydrolyzing) [Pyxidicoccus fallax]NMO21281.1 asparagine synthase (glutamine-hydrolyzing) [Pyxidicoccus fallax]NPC83903.1 asparagine synthase (glutamine-hydrolyzing) [Pyxidicoccus fallax]
MCGFIGVYNRASLSIDDRALLNALTTIHHRGPDERSLWHDPAGRAVLGHARLSIVGLNNGKQPIVAEEGDIALVVNGELYDHERQRRELEALGCRFKTESDSEIALHLYRRAGVAGLKQLRGEFAILLFDRQRRLMMAVRDRMGIKPLFYAQHRGTWYFASEIKALLAAGVPAEWDEDAYASRAFYLRDHTLFKGVRSVAPGCWVMVDSGGPHHGRYWDMEFARQDAPDPADEQGMVEAVRAAVEQSVRLRLRADVPVGVYLSGGIDSSAVLGVASRLSGQKLEAFNLSFTDMDEYDENRFARLAAEHNQARFHTVSVSQDNLADHFEQALWHNETPFFNAHGVAKYILSQQVRAAGMKVVLTGEGADEVFAGYPHFRRDMLLYNTQRQDPALVGQLRQRIQESENGYVQPEMPQDIHWMVQQLGHGVSWLDNQAGWFKALEALYRPDFHERFAGVDPYRQFYDRVDHRNLEGRDPVHKSMYLWAKSYLPNFVLTTLGDRMEMANSVEGRVPLLDHHVVELACRMPVWMKVRGSTEKYVFREAMRPYLPDALYKRKKHYFRAPQATLKQSGRLYQLVRDALHGPELEALPFFEPRKVRELLERLPRLSTHEQGLLDPMLMELTSLCLLQRRYGLRATGAEPSTAVQGVAA